MRKITLTAVKQAQPGWFSPENKRFFGDLSYQIIYGGDGRAYLVRKTNAWTDMFGARKKMHYRINYIDPVTLKIGDLIGPHLYSISDVREYLKTISQY